MLERSYDIAVTGGGLAGICAAIAAAREGARVALIHDRPLLGGNASGELRIHIAGADCSGYAIARHVRETGIIDEFRVDNLHRNYADSQDVLSLILREYVDAEESVDLYMNTRVCAVRMQTDDLIEAVQADQATTEKEFLLKASLFVDCTGDGFVGAKAGASFRIGREAAAEFGESLAPAAADAKTLPSCVEFYLKDMGQPVPFTAPAWAHRFESADDLPFRDVSRDAWQFGHLCGGFWWLSTGGDVSTIGDNEEIYDKLLRVVMGLWDYMKNRADCGAENFALDWVSPIPGKRESRRFEGDHWLSQNDVLNGTVFEDAVAYGGWAVDIHPPEGIFSREPPSLAVGLRRPYTIPLRCLYSKNIRNLMFAGRDASFTHVGLGSPRVMATCAAAGQAAGAAAAVAAANGLTPRQVQQDRITDVQQALLRQGAYIPYIRNRDPRDLALRAAVSASSEARLEVLETAEDKYSLALRPFQLFPISTDKLDAVDVLIESQRPGALRAGIRKAADIWDFASSEDLATCDAAAQGTGLEWVRLPLELTDIEPGLYWIWVEGDEAAGWCGHSQTAAPLVRGHRIEPRGPHVELRSTYLSRCGTFIFRLTPQSSPYGAVNAVNGVARAEQWSNLWMSGPIETEPEYLGLNWPEQVCISEVHLTFDGQLDSNLIWPPPLGVFGCGTLPSVAKRYDLRVKYGGELKIVHTEDANYMTRRVHRIEPVSTDTLRLCVHETNGVPEARLYEIRVY